MDKNEVKSILRAIEDVKKTLHEELAAIENDTTRSGEYKLGKRREARDKAEEELKSIRERANKLDLRIRNNTTLDYSNPELLAALSFIELTKDSLSKDAVRGMIDRLSGHPKELAFLRDVLGQRKHYEYAVMVNEAVAADEVKESFPQRLDDAIYYATDGNPEKAVDFSGIEAELDSIPE